MKRIFSLILVIFLVQNSFAQKNKNQEYELINHVVELGETIKLLSKKYLIDPGEIYQLNKFAINGISKGMILQIPVPVKDPVYTDKGDTEIVKEKPIVKPSEKKEPIKTISTSNAEVKQPSKEVVVINRDSQTEHIVEAKETMYSLSKKYGVSPDEIKLSNEQIAISGLQVGMVVKIPGTKKLAESDSSIGSIKTPVTETVKPQTKVEVSNPTTVTHIVEAKETLFSLSRKYGVTVDELIAQNKALLANGLKIGQSLSITKK